MKTKWNHSFLSRKYKFKQKKLSFIILWLSIVIAICWLAWKKGIWDMLIRRLGFSSLNIPFVSDIWNFFYTKASLNVLLVLFLAVYVIWRTIWIFCNRKKPVNLAPAYQYDSEAGFCILKQEFVQVRSFYQYILVAETVLVFVIKYLLEHNGGLEEVFVMIIMIFLYTWERFDYYNGYTAAEYQKVFVSETKEEAIIQKPDRVSVTELEKRLMEIQCSEDYKERCMGYYWYQTWSGISDVHMEFIEAALRLNKHQSIYFASAFYQDIGSYIFPFLNLELLENKRILVVSGNQNEEEVADWLRIGLQERGGKIEFWTTKDAMQEFNKAEIAVISFEHMQKIPECRDSYVFWYEAAVVFLLEPSCFIPCPLWLPQLLSRFSICREKPVYLVCGRNEDGMADWLSHIAKEEIFSVSPTLEVRENSYMVADIDAKSREEISSHIPFFTANAIEFAHMPRRAGEKICWYGNHMSPVFDMEHEIQKHKETAKIFEFYLDGTECVKREYAWSVVEDTVYNVNEVLCQYDTRGYKAAYTAVCSPHYMLRSFMLSHMEQRIFPLAPEFVCSRRNMAIAVGYELIKGNMDWEDIKRVLSYYHIDKKESIPALLKKLNHVYRKILGLDKMWVAEDSFYKEGESGRKRIVISTEEGRQQFIQWYKRNIDMVLWEGTNRREGLQGITGGHIYQYYLPGQFLTAEGKYYRVEEILESDGRRLIKVKRASDSCRHRRYYRQVKSIFLENSELASSFIEREDIQVEQYYADITVCTEENLCSSSFYDLKSADRRRVLVPKRLYRSKAYLKITVNSQTGMWVGLLLKEMFYTFFPQCWQLLSVAVQEKRWQEEMKGRLDSIKETEAEKNTHLIFYVIEDSSVDLGLIETIGGKFETILSLINQYVDWGNREGSEEIKKYFGSSLLQGISLYKEDSYVHDSGAWKSHFPV